MDITTRKDIENLMTNFYNRLFKDDSINFIFTDVAKIELHSHLPHIVDFWEQTILGSGSYHENVMKIHLDLNDKFRLEKHHFNIWLMHFHNVVEEKFSGPNAETMKTRALSMATVMQIKMHTIK